MKNYYISLGILFLFHSNINGQGCLSPSRIEVLPIFFVPQGGINPLQSQKDSLMHYLSWAQSRYNEMMKFRSTFKIADSIAHVYIGINNDSFYQTQTDGGASEYANELLTYFNYSRYNCPYIFLVVYMSPTTLFPVGGGRPINAGFNTGGGLVILSSYDLDNSPNFESTLQHELGHSFGLPHIDVYGYNMSTDSSIMSYNPNHHTSWFTPSITSGILIPENLRDLSLNKFVFPEMYFDSTIDIPSSYTLYPDIIYLGIFDIPNQSNYQLQVTTSSGETFGSQVANIVQHQIKPSILGLGSTFDSNNMWQSGTLFWAEAEIHFPFTVTIDKIGIHSQHSGLYNEADSLQIQTYSNGNYTLISLTDLTNIDQYISFSAVSDSIWKFSFRTGASNTVTIRGIEFFYEDEPIFPPLVPYSIQNPFFNQLPSKPILNYPIINFTTSLPSINFDWTSIQAINYRFQIDTNKSFCSPIINTVLPNNNYTYSNLLNNTNYYWRVKGLNNSGQGFGPWSEIRRFSTGTIQGINNLDSRNLILFPNPASDKLYFMSNEIIFVTIYNSLMQEIKTIKLTENSEFIDLENLNNGLYHFRFIYKSSETIYRKILKCK